MKNTSILTLIFIFLFKTLSSQNTYELWGTLPKRGPVSNNGSIYKTDSAGNNFSLVTSFTPQNANYNGYIPYNYIPVTSSAGKIYGASQAGGQNGVGTIFEFDPQTNHYQALYHFYAPTGKMPAASLVVSPDDKLFGIAKSGGPNNFGCIYSYNINSHNYSVLHYFNNLNDDFLIFASNAKLYGCLMRGGTNNLGYIFQCDTATGAFSVLYNFDSINGYNPFGNLVETNGGIIYGTTHDGGAYDKGVIFSFDINTGTYSKKFDFDSINGQHPLGGLSKISNSYIAGMTYSGGVNNRGVIFKYKISTGQFSKVHDFVSGKYPRGILTRNGAGDIYGVCPQGGLSNKGTVFKLDQSMQNFTAVFDFDTVLNGVPSGYNYSSLIVAGYGLLYGQAGKYFYKYKLINGAVTAVYNYYGYAARTPMGPLMQAADGYLYGTTLTGGIYNKGVIFRIDPLSGEWKVLYEFKQSDGINTKTALIQASNGKLYGNATGGGYFNQGTLYEYDIASNTLAVKKNYNLPPVGALTESNGKLYGVFGVSAGSDGEIFEYDMQTGTLTLKALLRYPFRGMVKAPNGKLYGVDMMGGAYLQGSLYEYVPGQNYTLIKHSFKDSTGDWPTVGLVIGNNGKFYGTTRHGGTNNSGVLYEYDMSTNTYTVLYNFPYLINGTWSDLMQSVNGKLYITTKKGGMFNYGQLLEYDLVSNTMTTKMDFNTNVGAYTYYAPVSVSYCSEVFDSLTVNTCGTYTVPSGDSTYTVYGNYTVYDTLQNSCGNDSILIINLTLSSCPGWEESQVNSLELKVFPNPAKNRFLLKLSGDLPLNGYLTIYDILGRRIYNRMINSYLHEYEEEITIKQKGVYLIKYRGKTKNISRKIMIY